MTMVRPGYFSTLGIELLQGRDFTLQDSPDSPRVVVVNRVLARHYFGDENPIGKRREFVEGNGWKLQIVGVVAAALIAGSLIKSFLFGVGRTDPITFAGICLLLSAAAFAACFLPARRATRVDPMVALRNE